MHLLIGTQQIQLLDLDPALDRAIVDIYRACLAGIPANYTAFGAAVQAYLRQPSANRDGYLTNFIPLWQQFFAQRQFERAERVWELVLDPVLLWEQSNPANHLHKGTPYYFWAMTTFEAGRLDAGFALMHQALKEDQAANPLGFRRQPAFLFVSLNFEVPHQAYRERVRRYADYINRMLQRYCSADSTSLTMSDVRSRFLGSQSDIETVFLLTYVVARLVEIERIPDHARQSVFAGQIQANVLFDLALIIDSGIHTKNAEVSNFIDLATFLAGKAGVPLTREDLGLLNADFKADFDRTLDAVLSLSYVLPRGTIHPLAGRIAVAYGMRNRGAHNVHASSTFFTRFDAVRDWMFECLFLTIETLY